MRYEQETPVEGVVSPQFTRVRDAFRANFETHGELGAAVAVFHRGARVVDLWGGWTSLTRAEPWQRGTMVNFFSVGKGLCAVAIAMLADRGLISMDDPVARVWPEFAAAGKQAITFRQVMSHQAGLAAVRRPLAIGDALRPHVMSEALAAQEAWWKPGTAHGYHANTLGFLVGEIVRRITGKSFGAFIQEEISMPLDADLYVGLPEIEHDRVSDFVWFDPGRDPELKPNRDSHPPTDEERMGWAAFSNPHGLSGGPWVNTKDWRKAELPSTNGHGTARSVACVYAALANGGEINGVRLMRPATLDAAVSEQVFGPDLILKTATRFGLGFQLSHRGRRMGPSPTAFGHFGAGGSLGFADPENQIALAYVMNKMSPHWSSPCNRALIEAVYASL